MATTDTSSLKRLKEEQEKALVHTDQELEQWNKFRSDYVALRDRLKTLPNKTTHSVMVPFGSLAFMPGQLVHTNEVLVLLGDNYFVERSAVQAADIVTRRLKKLNENIQALQKQREMLTPRAHFTSEMIQMASGEGEQQEIVEDYDEEKERQWRERHREYVRRAAEKQMKETAEGGGKDETKIDTDFWDVLDQLERQENERGELRNLDEGPLQAQNQSEQTGGAQDEEDLSSLDESNWTEEEEDSSDDEEEEDVGLEQQRTIRFSHTKQAADPSSSTDPAAESTDITDLADNTDNTDNIDLADNTVAINSPADLYRLVKLAPRSILKVPSKHAAKRSPGKRCQPQDGQEKKVSFVGEQPGGAGAGADGVKAGLPVGRGGRSPVGGETELWESSRKPRVQAFSDTVVERETPVVCAQPPQNDTATSGPAPKPGNGAAASRPVSKFRAARQQKTDVASADSQEQVDPHISSAAVQGRGVRSSGRPVSRFQASRMKQGGGS